MCNRLRVLLTFILVIVLIGAPPVYAADKTESTDKTTIRVAIPVSANTNDAESYATYVEYTLDI